MAKKTKEKHKSHASPGILKLPLGKCLTAPNSRFYADLNAVSSTLARARNAMVRYWQRWREDTVLHRPEKRAAYYDMWRQSDDFQDDEKLLKAWDEWVVNDSFCAPRVLYGERWYNGLGSQRFEGIFYQVGRRFDCTPLGAMPVKDVCTGLLPTSAMEARKSLTAEQSYRHKGQTKFIWEGVLYGENQLPDCERSIGSSIPVKDKSAILAWGELVSPSYHKATREARKLIDRYRRSQAVLLLPLFSPDAGRRSAYHVVRINTRFLPEGQKAVLENVILDTWPRSDSSLHLKEVRPNSKAARKGKKSRWYLHLCYTQPASATILDAERIAELVPNAAESADPFTVRVAEGTAASYEHVPKAWQIGDGVMARRLFQKAAEKKDEWNERHRARGSARRGHGRRREYRDKQQQVRAEQNLARDLELKLAVEAVRYCVRHRLGTLQFRPPSLKARGNGWYAKNGVPKDWTLFVQRLSHECWQNGVKLKLLKNEEEAPMPVAAM